MVIVHAALLNLAMYCRAIVPVPEIIDVPPSFLSKANAILSELLPNIPVTDKFP